MTSWLPAIVPSVPQALVPIQYTRRVPTEVPTIEQAIEQALPGTIIIVARGTPPRQRRGRRASSRTPPKLPMNSELPQLLALRRASPRPAWPWR